MTEEPQDPKVAELEARLVEMEARTTQRLINNDLKSAAAHAGLIDFDALRLIDTSALKLDDQGNLEGAARIIAELKRAKPYLFVAANTSAPATAPPATPPAARRATQMTHAEWQAARAELLRRG